MAIVWSLSCTAREMLYCFPTAPDDLQAPAAIALTLCPNPAASTLSFPEPIPRAVHPMQHPQIIPWSIPRRSQLQRSHPAALLPGADFGSATQIVPKVLILLCYRGAEFMSIIKLFIGTGPSHSAAAIKS